MSEREPHWWCINGVPNNVTRMQLPQIKWFVLLPPTSHSWMAPLVEDMLCDARTGLTKAVLTGPGRAVLFYGRHSMGRV